MHAVLWFCIFDAACIGMSRRAIWLENIGAMEFVNADCYFHAMRAIHKLGIQVWPSPDVMLFMGEEDTRSKVDMLSIGVEDSLPHCTVEEFAAGFQEDAGFRDMRQQAAGRLVRQGHRSGSSSRKLATTALHPTGGCSWA